MSGGGGQAPTLRRPNGSLDELGAQSDPSAEGESSTDEALAAGLTAERLVVLPFYHELRNALVRPERIRLQTEYFWQKWVPLLGPVRALIVMRMRQFGYYNRQTGELRDEVARTYDEIAQSIGISTRSLERYFESEPDPGGGPFRVLKDPLLARFIRLRHQYVWRPGKSAPERTTNEYKIAMDEPLTPDDEAALRLAAARRLRNGAGEDRDGRLGRATRGSATRQPHTRQTVGYEGEPREAEPSIASSPAHTRQSVGYAGPPERQSDGSIGADAMAAQPVIPLDPIRRRPEIQPSQAVNAARGESAGLDELIATFAAANSREVSPLERQLLGALVEEVEPWAKAVGSTGASWVVAAVVEAVESGSRYVAPRRIREICRRWAREGVSPSRAEAGQSRSGQVRGGVTSPPPAVDEPGGRGARSAGARPPRRDKPATYSGRDGPERVWDVAPDRAVDGSAGNEELPRGDREGDDPTVALPAPTFLVDEALGLNNRQLWAAVLDELRRSVPAGTFATWLKPTRLVGLADDGALIVGAPNSFAKEWLGERLAAQVEAALGVVLGHRRGVRFEVEREWLAGSR